MEHDIKENGYGVIKDVVTESFHSKINTLANMYIERCMKRQGYTGNIGYRFVTGLDLARAPSADFQGVVFQLGLKVGLFNELKK